MPKKFTGENSKAAVAKARKEEKRLEEVNRKQKEAEDAYWREDDKHVNKKQQRKEDREKKRTEQVEKKHELRKLHDEEMGSMNEKKSTQTAPKITRAQIDERRAVEMTAAARAVKSQTSVEEAPLVENLNRAMADVEEARTVDEAISVLSIEGQEAVDMHPEKRMKAAYTKFEEENLPVLKRENPNMRLSQLKQLLKKQWMKSPDNPLNQRIASLNAKGK